MKLVTSLWLLVAGVLFVFLVVSYPPTTTFAQVTGCPSSGSTPIRITDNSGNSFLTVGPNSTITQFSTQGKCVTGNRAVIPQFGIPTYSEMLSIFYDQLKTTPNKFYKNTPSLTGNFTQTSLSGVGSEPQLFHIKKSSPSATDGNLLINGNLPQNKLRVIFVDGNLEIGSNINEPPPKTGTFFIVQGEIKIDPSVTRIEAILLNYGEFCSAYNFPLNFCPSSQDAQPLVIQGSVLYLNPTPNSTPKFIRNNTSGNNATAAEQINYEPKYLVLLKDIISRDLSVWSER